MRGAFQTHPNKRNDLRRREGADSRAARQTIVSCSRTCIASAGSRDITTPRGLPVLRCFRWLAGYDVSLRGNDAGGMKHLFPAVAQPSWRREQVHDRDFEAQRIEPQHAVPPDPRLSAEVCASRDRKRLFSFEFKKLAFSSTGHIRPALSELSHKPADLRRKLQSRISSRPRS
jgi:hypothetical protein